MLERRDVKRLITSTSSSSHLRQFLGFPNHWIWGLLGLVARAPPVDPVVYEVGIDRRAKDRSFDERVNPLVLGENVSNQRFHDLSLRT